MLRSRDEADIANPGLHECGQRIIDHGFVVDRHELLAHAQGKGIEAGPRSSCQQYTFPLGHDVSLDCWFDFCPWPDSISVLLMAHSDGQSFMACSQYDKPPAFCRWFADVNFSHDMAFS